MSKNRTDNNDIRFIEKMPRWGDVDNELANDFVDQWIVIYTKFQIEAEDLLERAKSCNAKLVMLGNENRPLRDIVIQFVKPV